MREFPAAGGGVRVLLLGLDGVVWQKTQGIAPELQQLADQGSFHAMTMEPPTWSGPGWASILTGSTHAEHGVQDNSFTGHRLFNRPDLLSRAFYADQSTRTLAVAGWPPLVDPAGLGPVIHERREQQFAGLHRVVVRDGETYGYIRADAEVRQAALQGLRSPGGFDVGFVYFCDIDDAGH
ncbi:MAG: alkaline phosphatase family protein, partial [Propionibacteriaceae bacterium]|nr:alkaline phosphatase family protein [Propionibacteriaceae bacterium]